MLGVRFNIAEALTARERPDGAGKGGRIRTRDLRVGTGCFGQAKLRPYGEHYWDLRAVSIRVLRGHNPTLFH
jgi:hypothetical protein